MASAGEQVQVQKVLNLKGFKLGNDKIYGSPEPKLKIAKRLKFQSNDSDIIFFGDSVHDAECSLSIGARFVFVSGFTDTTPKEIYSVLGNRFTSIIDFTSPDLRYIVDL